ncbi:PTS transporter subunit EIIC [Lactobacillus kalixensis]
MTAVSNRMMDTMVAILFWLRQRSFFRVVQRTLIMLMPVATLGAYFRLLHDCVFSPDSLIYNLFNFDAVMSDTIWYLGNDLSLGMMQVTFGMFGIFVAYFAAKYTARIYNKDSTMAGITAVLVIALCASLTVENTNSNQVVFMSRLININGTLFAILIGYSIGQVFRWVGKDYIYEKHEHVNEIQRRVWNSLLPTAVAIIIGAIFALIIYFFKLKLIDSSYARQIISELRSSNNILVVVWLTIVSTFLWWLGLGYPLQALSNINNTGAALVNSNYAFRHGSAANVPYKFLGGSMIKAYGVMGNASIILALIVVLLLYTNNKEVEAIAKLNLLPAAFGVKNGIAIGVPVILNPLYLLPVICIPAINELIAAAAISLNLIMPSAYPVLSGSPGILISFFGTNGDWGSFIFTVLLFILDILIYVPFVLMGIRIEEKVREYDARQQD